MVKVACPECQQRIDLDSEPKIGQHITCQSCKTEFQVTWLFPICLDYLEITEQIPASPDESLSQCSSDQ
jgi:uncharacterized protein YbaR (Trm112 family)